MAEIALERVTKRFPDGTVAVRDVTFTVADGERFVLVGPSGCGKSTVLNLIVGLEPVSAGEIRVDGRAVTGLDPRERNMAMVFQSYALYPHLSVAENIAFPLRLAGVPAPEVARRVGEVAELLALGGLLDRRPAVLSGGERQRVAMGRAIVRRPVAYLMDEPLSNLDARLRLQMRAEIARLQRRLGTTTVYVTHDQVEAMTLGDRLAVMREGQVLQVGTPRDLYERPHDLFVAGFIGSPPMNLLAGRLAGDRVVLPVGEITLDPRRRASLPTLDGPVVAGLRPEHLQPANDRAAVAEGGGNLVMAVDVVEWLGAELYVHCVVPTAPGPPARLVARLDPATRVAEGERIILRAEPATLLLFDPASGARLTPDDPDGERWWEP